MSVAHEQLKELLRYDPETGQFTRLVDRGKYRAGSVAGAQIDRYLRISIGGKWYRAHRLAWFYMTGEWPSETVDHENRDPLDNRWANLRLASVKQQQQNRGVRRDNTSGHKGVMRHKNGRFYARVTIDGKKVGIGGFETPEAANAAFIAKAREVYGDFACAG
jgi:hypothetical protein